MAFIDELMKIYPGWSPDEIANAYAQKHGLPLDQAYIELGIAQPGLTLVSKLFEHPHLFLGTFIAEPLAGAALAYGLVWLAMRPKGGKKIRNPLLWHAVGVTSAVIGSAIFRLIAIATFAGRSAYKPAMESGAAGFYMLIVPAIVAVGYIHWLKKKTGVTPPKSEPTKVATPEMPPPTVSLSVKDSIAIDEDAIYTTIAKELETGATDKGLWTRLFAEYDGDENRTKAAYIRERAEKLKST